MINARAKKPTLKVMHVATLMLAAAVLVGCSREKIDWKSAEAADSVEAYDHFLERHPDGELSAQARARVAQLNEERDWKRASAADTADAYRQFLAQHENGKWAGEARIRVENFALDGSALGPARPGVDAESAAAGSAAPPVATQPAPAVAAAPAQHAASAPPAASLTPKPAPATALASPSKPVATAAVTPSPKPAATTPAAKPAVPAVDPASQFGIQLGAFSSQQAALTEWKRIQGRFDSDLRGLFAHAVPVHQGAGQLFRLQAPVGGEARARSICASLAKQSQPCVIVLPQSH